MDLRLVLPLSVNSGDKMKATGEIDADLVKALLARK